MGYGCVKNRLHSFLTLKTETLIGKFRNYLNALLVYYYSMCTHTRLIFFHRVSPILACEYSRGGTWVNFCWVCAAGNSEPLPHYSLFCGLL